MNPIEQAIEALERIATSFNAGTCPEQYLMDEAAKAVATLKAHHQAAQDVELPPPYCWNVYIPSQQSGYVVYDDEDPQMVEDLTNCPDATKLALYTEGQVEAAIAAHQARQAVPQGWSIRRSEDGKGLIVWKAGLGGYCSNVADESIASSILAHLAQDMLAAAPAPEASKSPQANGFGPKLMPQVSGFDQPTQAEAPSGFAWVLVNGRPMLARMDATTNPTVAQFTTHPAPEQVERDREDALAEFFALHAAELEGNAYAYCELAYTRQTGWMAWITDKPLAYTVVAPDRKVLAQGQGDTPEEAARDAIRAAREATKGGA